MKTLKTNVDNIDNDTDHNKSNKSKIEKEVIPIEFEATYQYDAVCPHENKHFSSVKEWKAHHMECHMNTKWKCPLCDTISASWHNYSYHVQIQEHNGICPPPWICKLKLPSITIKNKKAHSTINKDNNNHQHHPLKSCEKRFGSKYQLLRHIKSEHTNYELLNVNYFIYIYNIYIIFTIFTMYTIYRLENLEIIIIITKDH